MCVCVCVILYSLPIGWGEKYKNKRDETDEFLSNIDADNKLNRATLPDSGGDKKK